MQIVSQDTSTDITAYTLERAKAFGRSAPELNSLLGSFGLFLSEEVDTTPTEEWIDEDDYSLVEDDPRITQARENLTEVRKVGNPDMEKHASNLSRCTEWVVLLEMFTAVIPDTSESAA